MLDCYYMDVSGDCSKEQSLALYEMLSVDRRNKVDRLRDAYMKEKQIKIGAFLQYVLGKYLNVEPQYIEFRYNPQGKPAVKIPKNITRKSEIHFNMSHSGDYAVLAVGDSLLGIDIEKKRTGRLNVAKRCFCKEEYEDIVNAGDEDAQAERFLEYWTLKEAFVKYVGDGLAVPLNSFLIKRETSYYRVVLQNGYEVQGDTTDINNVILESMIFLPGYRISVCHNYNESTQNAKKISLIDIMN